MGNWTERFLSMLFPPKCPICKAITKQFDFCEDCKNHFPSALIEETFPLESSRKEMKCMAPLPYQGEYRKVVHRLKFSHKKIYAKTMGYYMAERFMVYPQDWDEICFVPMTKKEQKQRGYNQSELLAVNLSEKLKVPVLPILLKIKETDRQQGLHKVERRQNVQGVFKANASCKEKRILLVDDVVTTGATLKSAAESLYAAGAEVVQGVCFAATPSKK